MHEECKMKSSQRIILFLGGGPVCAKPDDFTVMFEAVKTCMHSMEILFLWRSEIRAINTKFSLFYSYICSFILQA